MLKINIILVCSLNFMLGITKANLSGPFLIWGHGNLNDLRTPALKSVSENDLSELLKTSKGITIYYRNDTQRLEGFPKFQNYLKNFTWFYVPQYSLPTEFFLYNENVEVIPLSESNQDDDLIRHFQNAGIEDDTGTVGVLANYKEGIHSLSKRENNDNDGLTLGSSTLQTPLSEDTEQSKIYLADGMKAILFVNTAPILNIFNGNETFKLEEHNKAVTFDDQKYKGYGRLNLIFNVDGEKVFLRFNFSLTSGSWSLKAVEVEYKEYKFVLPIVGNIYNIPVAPLGFSYRCSTRPLLFQNNVHSLKLHDYQIQPWLNGELKFGDALDCVGFSTGPIWSGILISFFLLGILSIGIIALMDIKTPNRFENSRKQLTLIVQD